MNRLKYLASVVFLVPVVACLTPSTESVGSTSAAASTTGGACGCCTPQDPTATAGNAGNGTGTGIPPSYERGCPPLCPIVSPQTPSAELVLAPGDTRGLMAAYAPWSWPTTFSIAGLPAGVSTVATSIAGTATAPPGVTYKFVIPASTPLTNGPAHVTVTASASDNLGAPVTATMLFYLTIAGVCVPDACNGNQCNSPPDGCGGALSCNDCDSTETCNTALNECESKRVVTCAKGTQDCGGFCAKRCE
jgi:hypothetical protein